MSIEKNHKAILDALTIQKKGGGGYYALDFETMELLAHAFAEKGYEIIKTGNAKKIPLIRKYKRKGHRMVKVKENQ